MDSTELRGFLHASYSRTLSELQKSIQNGWSWPEPNSGFAIYVLSSQQGTTADFLSEVLKPDLFELPTTRSDEAPVIAAHGFLFSRFPDRVSPQEERELADGLAQVSKREALRADRQSFFFRPVELLGISLASQVVYDSHPDGVDWMKDTIEVGGDFYHQDNPWRQLVAGWAASVVNANWRPDSSLAPSDMSVSAKALALHLSYNHPAPAQVMELTDERNALEESFLEEIGTTALPEMSVSRLAAAHATLHHLITSILEEVVNVYRDPERQKRAEREKAERRERKQKIASAESFCEAQGRVAYWIVRILGIPLLLGGAFSAVSLYFTLPEIPTITENQSLIIYVLTFYATVELIFRSMRAEILQNLADRAVDKWKELWKTWIFERK